MGIYPHRAASLDFLIGIDVADSTFGAKSSGTIIAYDGKLA